MIFKVTDDLQYIRLMDEISDAETFKLKLHFHRKCKNFYFDPAYKLGWDGCDDFFNAGYIKIGLWRELRDFMVDNRYPVRIDGLEKLFNLSLNKDEFDEFVTDLIKGTTISEPRWYQLQTAYLVLKYRYCMAEIATSGGKTLTSFIVASYLKHIGKIDKYNKFLMVVPRIPLVQQTYEKFAIEYNNGMVPLNIRCLGGKDKVKAKDRDRATANADVIITTYQSLGHKQLEFYAPIRHFHVDEAHTATNDTIKTAINSCSMLEHRFGMSGTLEIEQTLADYFRMEEYLGPNVLTVTAGDLIDSAYSPDVNIRAIRLLYDESDPAIAEYLNFKDNGRDQFPTGDAFAGAVYRHERRVIRFSEARLRFVVNICSKINNNVLLLFNDVKDQYGKIVYDRLIESGKKAYYIDGHTDEALREQYTHDIENDASALLVASYGCFSTGLDLKRIFNIIFLESYKSPILIRQSIGRGMRNYKGKASVNIIDLIDDFGKYSNKHYTERKTIYATQRFGVSEYEMKI